MRLGPHVHRTSRRTALAPLVVAATGLILAACSSDSPTAVSTSDTSDGPVANLTIPPGAAGPVGSQGHVKVFPTLAHMNTSAGSVASSGATTNSPWNLTYFGGPTLTSATLWNVYVDCATTPAQCWGTGTLTPATYLKDLNVSSLILVADQYLHENASDRWSVSQLNASYTFPSHIAADTDIYKILYAAVQHTHETGYHNVYNVFLPEGQDLCFGSLGCYSPDNPSSFTFCAFHGYVDFGSKHVLFTVQPYQFVAGCPLPTQTRVIDATASTLSHETFETMTDPDLDAWFNALEGDEVADLCFGFRFPTVVGQRTYVVQEIYSNDIQDCTNGAY